MGVVTYITPKNSKGINPALMEEIKTKIEEVNQKIIEVDDRIVESGTKINEMNSGLAELDSKIVEVYNCVNAASESVDTINGLISEFEVTEDDLNDIIAMIKEV